MAIIGFFLKTRKSKLKTLLFLMLVLVLASDASAVEVGKFTQVEGQVELLKAGQSKAVPATAETGVEEKDVIKTGEESRAQLHFKDDTTLIIAPQSQIIIESYIYDPQKGKRQIMLEVAQGLLQAVVTKVFKEKEPDFLVKTQTAVMGVRGTEFYVLVIENQENPTTPDTSGFAPDFLKAVRIRAVEAPQSSVSTDVFVKSGRVSMSSSNPKIKETVLLGPLQSTRVLLNRAPGSRINLTPKDLQRLQTSLVTGVTRARVGHTRNPRELLERLPMKQPPRPGPPLRPGGGKPSLEGRLPTPAAKPPGSAAMPPKGKEKPAVPAAKPLKPGPPPAAAKLPPKGEQRRLTPPKTAPKELTPAGKKPVREKSPVKPKYMTPKAAQTPAKMKEPARAPAKAPAAKPKEPPLRKPTPSGTRN